MSDGEGDVNATVYGGGDFFSGWPDTTAAFSEYRMAVPAESVRSLWY